MLMKKAVDSGKLRGFKFDKDEHRFTHLQNVDDPVIICEKSWTNIYSIKAILLLFKAMSELKVNFHKSSIVGLNVPHFWIDETTSILKCKVDSLPLKFLVLPIGANPNRLDTWNPVVKAVKSRLSQWNRSQLSIGGWVVIFKNGLFVILVYFLSFFKAPTSIISKLESMFKQFLWGCEEKRKINWVKWENVCR